MIAGSIPAVFMRGGTSKAIMFHARDLPADRHQWDPIFLAAMGSPDPYGRQLDGMGGGLSSLSKVCVIAPSSREDADVDFTFAQVLIKEARVDYRGSCGNMSSAIGPFALDEGLVASADGQAFLRIFNTNTAKIMHAHFPAQGGRTCYAGDLAIPGVSGTGGAIRLDFLDPGGAVTGKLLPSGQVCDRLQVPDRGPVEASLIDAANAVVFVRAADLGLTGHELPGELEARPDLLHWLAEIRAQGSLAMGITHSREEALATVTAPALALVSPASDWATLSGERLVAADMDFTIRVLSNGQPHRASPLTAALCSAVAARCPGSVVAGMLSAVPPAGTRLRLGTPSGVLSVDARMNQDAAGDWHAQSGSFFRTARRLFDGRVWLD
jgi:2-methylaconitate cis-trans-isomerase PrpF